jgi:ribonuclease HI
MLRALLLGRQLAGSPAARKLVPCIQPAASPACLAAPKKKAFAPLGDAAPHAGMAKKKSCYAVVRGRMPGLYYDWTACSQQVTGYKDNHYKGFSDEREALAFLQQHGLGAGGAAPGPPAAAAAAAAALAQPQQWPPAQSAAYYNSADEYAVPSYPTAIPSTSAGVYYAAAAPPLAALQPAFKEEPWEEEEEGRRVQHRGQETGIHAYAPAAPAIETGGATAEAAPRDPSAAAGLRLRLEFDGASKSNPGPAGLGAALYDEATGQQVYSFSHYMGDYVTNNQAEYGALIAGMQVRPPGALFVWWGSPWALHLGGLARPGLLNCCHFVLLTLSQAALDLGCRSLVAQGDSLLVVNQVTGRWQVKHAGLAPYHAAARQLAARFATFQARQVPREQNKVADALSNEAIIEWRSGAKRRVWTLEEVKELEGEAGRGGGKRQRR